MSLRDIMRSRAISDELEDRALRAEFEAAKQEFYNQCHGEDGRFCEGPDGPGRIRSFLGGRKAKNEAPKEKLTREESDAKIANKPRSYRKAAEVKVDTGQVAVGDPAYLDGLDYDSEVKSKVGSKTTMLDRGVLSIPSPKNGSFDVTVDDNNGKDRPKSVRIGFSGEASGPYKVIGDVGVDSGQITVGDPKSYDHSTYDEMIDDIYADYRGKKRWGVVKLRKGGVIIPTYWGDGVYPVSAQHDSDGNIQSIRVDFEWDEEDE